MKTLYQHPGLAEAWSGLQGSSYDLYLVHYTVDTVGQPVLDPGAQIVLAFDRLKGMAVLGFHDDGPVSEVWDMTCLLCGELREHVAMQEFPIKPLVVSSSLPAYDLNASFLPPRSFVGAGERVSGVCLDSLLVEPDVVAHPFLLDVLKEVFVLVEPYVPYELAEYGDQSSKYSLILVNT